MGKLGMQPCKGKEVRECLHKLSSWYTTMLGQVSQGCIHWVNLAKRDTTMQGQVIQRVLTLGKLGKQDKLVRE